MGHSVSRLRDFTDYDMDSPYTARRPSSHTAYIPEPALLGQPGSSPARRGGRGYTEPHLPSFHHDHLHHAGQETLGVSTLQPDTQRRERAREALLRRGCDGQVERGDSVDSGDTVSHSGSSRTTENPTEQTVVIKHQMGPAQPQSQPHPGGQRLVPGVKVHMSSHSLHSTHSVHSHHTVHNVGQEDEQNSDDQLSSEDNLSHESYDLLDKEQAAAHYNSDTLKTILSYDNSPYTPSKIPVLEHDNGFRDDLINSNLNIHVGSKLNSHSSTYSSHQSVNSSGLSASPLPDQAGAGQCEPQSILSRRRSSGTLSQKSKSSKDSVISESKSESRHTEARISLREGHFLSEDVTDDFQGHEIHMSSRSMTSSPGQPLYDSMTNHQVNPQLPGHGMHENILFQSPTNAKYFSQHIQHRSIRGLEAQQLHASRTLPNRKRREKSPAVFTTGKLSLDCSSASSSSHASPRLSRPKSLDFSVVALQDLPQSTAYSYRDDTIEQHDFEENSSSTVSQGQNNYASSSDVPATPEVPITAANVTQSGVGAHQFSRVSHISRKQISTLNSSKHSSLPLTGINQERIYDIPEGIERDEFGVELHQPIRGGDRVTNQRQPPQPQPRTVFQILTPNATYKNYIAARKFSSEDSETIPANPKLKIFPPPMPRSLKKVSSTESESASLPPVPGFDSDTLSLPLDLISPPLESENSTDLVDSESLPAPPQFGSNSKDDTDIEDEVTPKGEDLVTSETADLNGQPEKSKFGFRVAPLALQNIELVPPTRQESTYEARAERLLEAQLSRTDTFNEGHLHHHPHLPHLHHFQHRQSLEIIDLDKELTNGKNPLLDNILLKALDSYDSFNNDPLKVDSRENSVTYEENAESALEKQTTIESFTSQNSADNDVFYDQSIENKVQELNDANFSNRRDQILESQSTFESFTTECEVLVTKRQESTYEERAETVLESQNTIESFTNEVPNDEVFDHEPPLSESSFLNDEDCETQIEADRGSAGTVLVANMLVRQLDRGREDSELLDSCVSSVPFMNDSFEQDLAMLSSTGARLACGQGDRIVFNNFTSLPGVFADSVSQSEPHSAASSEPIYVEPNVTRSDSGSSFDVTPVPGPVSVETEDRGQMTECLDYPGGQGALTGPYDTEPPPPLPPDEFGNFTVPHEPLYYRADGFRGSFPMRTLSR